GDCASSMRPRAGCCTRSRARRWRRAPAAIASTSSGSSASWRRAGASAGSPRRWTWPRRARSLAVMVRRKHEAPSAPYRQWGDGLEPSAVQQLVDACSLPVAVRGALMPDAHPGYGLPIGGVLATRRAVIPYAVGVDIACRVKLSVLDLPLATLAQG